MGQILGYVLYVYLWMITVIIVLVSKCLKMFRYDGVKKAIQKKTPNKFWYVYYTRSHEHIKMQRVL